MLGVDTDGDGFIGSVDNTQSCSSPGTGYALTPLTITDCNDSDDAVNAEATWYVGLDTDGDGFIGSVVNTQSCSSPGAVYALTPQTITDCNDNDNAVNAESTWYVGVDTDGDGFIGSVDNTQSCNSLGVGYALTPQTITDCNDTNANINPGITEIPYNGIDDDCNAATLDDDLDSDGYDLADDCDDNDPLINPGATEIPGNSVDEDCDGIAQTTLGNNNFNIENVLITPNPFNETITIKVPIGYYNHDFNVTLFDLNGRTIYNTLEASNNGKLNISNGLIELNNGAYFIQITSKELGTSVIKKLIKY